MHVHTHSSFYSNLQMALVAKRPYKLYFKQGEHTHARVRCFNDHCVNVHVLPKLSRYFGPPALDEPSKLERDQFIAELLLRDMQTSAHDKTVAGVARRFLRTFTKVAVDESLEPVIQALRDEYLAMRFGINSVVFRDNPGLGNFLDENHLYYNLRHYGHRIEVVEDTGQAKMLVDGEWKNWDWIQGKIPQTPKGGMERHKYCFEGIQIGTVSQWDTLQPFDWEDPKGWGEGYAVDICCNCGEKPNVTGDHTWIRLKRPDGGIISVGQYRPAKRRPKDNFVMSTAVKPAILYQPDISEFFPAPFTTITIRVSAEEYESVKARVENDKQSKEEFYQLIHYNCTQYTIQLLKLVGVDIPSTIACARVIAPERFVRLADSIEPYLPELARRVCSVAIAFVMNCLQVALGGRRIHPSLDNHPAQPPAPAIQRLWDMFKEERVRMHHPYIVGQVVRKEIEQWRAKSIGPLMGELEELKLAMDTDAAMTEATRHMIIRRIELIEREIARISFAVPPKWCSGDRALQQPLVMPKMRLGARL